MAMTATIIPRVSYRFASACTALTTLLVLFTTLLIAAQPTHGAVQQAGEIHGTITDAKTGDPVASANVLLVGTERGAASDLDGEYTITPVPPGVYAIRFSAVGYEPVVRTDIAVSTARPVVLDIELEPSAVELEEVTFTAGYFRQPGTGEVSTTVTSNEEIRRLPGGFEDVARALSILPGIAQVSPGRNDFIVRGGAPSENLFLVDNYQVPNINHFGSQGSTGGPQSFINLDFVEKTEFNTGGFGVRYGDKLSSVLRVDLREGRDDRLGGKATVSASQFGLNLEGPYADGQGSFLFSARRSYLDFIFKSAGFAFVPEYWDFLAKTDYDIDPKNQVSVLALSAIDNVRLFNDDADDRYDNSTVPASDQVYTVGGATWKHFFSRGFTTLSAWSSTQDFSIVQRDSLLNPIFENESFEQEVGIKGEVLLQLNRETDLLLGAQQQFVGFNIDTRITDYESTYGEDLSFSRQNDETSFKTAAFAEVERQFGFLQVRGGLRADYFDLIEDGLTISPRLAGSYALTDRSNLNLALGRYYQSPSYVWLTEPGNRDLKPIGADQIVAGIDFLARSDVRLSLEGFYKQYFDYPTSLDRPYLVLANTGAGYGSTQDNFSSYGFDRLVSEGSGWSRGLELFAQKRAAENPHYAIASLTWSETWMTALDGVERPSSFDQRWLFNIGGGFIFNRHWETSFKFRLATGSPYTPFETGEGDLPAGSQDPDRYNSQRTPINHSLDLRVDRRWFFDSWTLITYVDVQNVYNNAYEGPPRWDERTQSLDTDESIGLLPSIGISAEF